jgi:flagellar protein FliO/FliZ
MELYESARKRAVLLFLAAGLTLMIGSPGGAGAQAKQGSPAPGAGAQAAPAEAQKTAETDLLIPEGRQPAAGGAEARPTAASAVSTWDFVRMILILAAVVGLIYLLFWVLRKGTGRKIQENELIRVLGSKGLSGNRAMHLIEVGRSIFLVGASEGGVELISEITDKESLDALRLKVAEQGPAARRTFQDVLADIFKPARKPFSMNESVDLLKRQRERLRKL